MSVTEKTTTQETAVLEVGGMTCSSCAVRIEKALNRLPGVAQAAVNLATEQARVQFDPSQAGPDDLIRAVQQEGYEAKVSSVGSRRAISSPVGAGFLSRKSASTSPACIVPPA